VNQLKLALRQLRLRPGLSIVTILMLALGIGATTAMFSLYHQILVRPLSVPEPERLVNLAAPGPKPGGGVTDLGLGNREAQFTYPMFRDLQNAQTGFSGIAAHVDFLANLSFDDRPTSGRGWFVSGSYFEVLNLRPAVGRLIASGDDARVGESAVTVLSYEFWQRGFGRDPNVVGKTLLVNGQGLEIVGVAPAGFRGTNMQVRADVFVPLTMAPVVNSGLSGAQMFESRVAYWLYLFARLAPGATLERATAELNAVYSGTLRDVEAPQLSTPRIQQQLPAGTLDRFVERQIAFSPGAQGQSNLPTTAGRPLTLLLGVTVLVLLIVCVNIANLLLARGAARAGEMATRASLGASRGWLVRQLLTESFVLIAIGGVASLGVAALIVRLISGLLPAALSTGLAPELSSTAMLLAAGVSLVTVIVFGLVPAWRVSDANPALAMKVHAARSGGGRAAMRFRGALSTAQIAFSMLLLVLAGLFTKSLMNVARQDLGLEVDSIVSFSVSPRLNAYSPDQLIDFYDRLEDTLAAQPGVVSVGSSGIPLLGDFALRNPFSVEGVEGTNTTAALGMVGTDFFTALGVTLRAGRAFTERDAPAAPQVAIVNESFARRFDLGTDVGQRLAFGVAPTNFPFEIVGIVSDSRHASVKGENEPVVYLSRYQAGPNIQAMFYYLRTSVDPDALLATIPRVVAEFDPEVPVTNLKTMGTTVNESVYIDRLLSMLSAGFALLATLLAGIGLYGVLAYNVTQRTRELGLRLALGAKPRQVRSMVLTQVGVMAAVGAAVGLVAALALGRVAESVLFGLSGRDPVVLIGATAVLAVVVLAGSWLPARRASNIAPTVALRYE
jgi:predicted permease